MPLTLKKTLEPEGLLGIWDIKEDESYFLEALDLYPGEDRQLEQIKGFRRLEWLACRHLVHFLSGRQIRGAILKDKFGKPFLEESTWEISMSHSGGKAAVIAAPYLVGVDIQNIVPRISTLAPRFCNREELDGIQASVNPIEAAHVIWGAKESLYKIYGKGKIDFRKDLAVYPFDYDPNGGQLQCKVLNHNFIHKFYGEYTKIDNFIFVYIQEDSSPIPFKD